VPGVDRRRLRRAAWNVTTARRRKLSQLDRHGVWRVLCEVAVPIGRATSMGGVVAEVAMSHIGQSRLYAEERYEPPPRRGTPWKYSPPPSKASEYHLIDLFAGVSQGGFETLTGARQSAREKSLSRVGYLPLQCSGRIPRSAMRPSSLCGGGSWEALAAPTSSRGLSA
jgi:hypothetical protein